MDELLRFVDELNKSNPCYILHPDGKIYRHENGHIKLVENIYRNFVDKAE